MTANIVGPSMTSAAFRYVHEQGSAAAVWTITHNLGGFPNVTTIDSAGDDIEGVVSYPDSNTLVLTFASAVAGKAYLS